MSFIFKNPNPFYNLVGDCVVRAISISMNKEWDEVYLELAIQGYKMKDMPSSNSVWESYLQENGYKKFLLPDNCPNCYRVAEFCTKNPHGSYILATGSHVIAAKNGNWYDTWDSASEVITSCWKEVKNVSI